MARQGVKRFLFLTGYRSNKIQEYFAEGQRWGVDIRYSVGEVEWETTRRLVEAHPILDEQFLLLYADNYIDFEFNDYIDVLGYYDQWAVCLTLSRKSPGNITLVGGLVSSFESARNSAMPFVEIGYMFINREKFWPFIVDVNTGLDENIRNAVRSGLVRGVVHDNPYQSVSDPARWAKANDYFNEKQGNIH
jgi:NDP-sugar pyrophosphorylase family protein